MVAQDLLAINTVMDIRLPAGGGLEEAKMDEPALMFVDAGDRRGV